VRKLFDEEITGYDMAVRKVLERENIDRDRRNVLLSHQFYTSSGEMPLTCDSETVMAGGIENVDVSVLAPFDYAALGHIHRPQKTGRENYRYCGTPLAYSVSEAEEQKSITVVELGKKGEAPVISLLPLTPLRQVRKMTGPIEEILDGADETNCHDFVSITLTDDVEAYRPRERLEEKFDHILEIRVDNARTRKILEFPEAKVELLNPYEAFCNFFSEMNGREMTKEENAVILDVIDRTGEAKDK
jgi:exonuclease SbcD